MKSTVNKQTKKSKIPYPKLMINQDTIVLMNSDGSGQVINSTDPDYPIGLISEEWVDFIEFDGSVTLSND